MMKAILLNGLKMSCMVAVYPLLCGLSIISLNYQSPEVMSKGQRAFSFGASGAFLNGNFNTASEELQIGGHYGWSDRTELGIKAYVSSGKDREARGFGIYGEGKYFWFKKPLFTVSGSVGFSYCRCRLTEFFDLVSADIFGINTSLLAGKRVLYVGYRSQAELILTSSEQLSLRQYIAFLIGGTIGEKYSVTPELCYYYSGLGRDYGNDRDDFVVGLGFRYVF